MSYYAMLKHNISEICTYQILKLTFFSRQYFWKIYFEKISKCSNDGTKAACNMRLFPWEQTLSPRKLVYREGGVGGGGGISYIPLPARASLSVTMMYGSQMASNQYTSHWHSYIDTFTHTLTHTHTLINNLIEIYHRSEIDHWSEINHTD